MSAEPAGSEQGTPSAAFPPVPTALPGQIAYAVYKGGEVRAVNLAEARSDRTYVLEAVCRPREGRTAPVGYEVRSLSGERISAGGIGCAGSVQRDTALVGVTGRFALTLTGPFSDVSEVFAAIVPE